MKIKAKKLPTSLLKYFPLSIFVMGLDIHGLIERSTILQEQSQHEPVESFPLESHVREVGVVL